MQSLRVSLCTGAKLGQIHGEEVAKVAKIDLLPGFIFEKVYFLAFLRKAIKKVYFYAKRLKNSYL